MGFEPTNEGFAGTHHPARASCTLIRFYRISSLIISLIVRMDEPHALNSNPFKTQGIDRIYIIVTRHSKGL